MPPVARPQDIKPGNTFISYEGHELAAQGTPLEPAATLQHALPSPSGHPAALAPAHSASSLPCSAPASPALPSPPCPSSTPPAWDAAPVFMLGDYGAMRERGRQHLHYFVQGFG